MSEPRQALLNEIQDLPDYLVNDVLMYVRFLRFRDMTDAELATRFDQALAQARYIARQRSITDDDIQSEVRSVRAQR